MRYGCHRLNAGKRRKILLQLVQVGVTGPRDSKREHVLCPEAWVHVQHVYKCPHEQSRSYQKHESQSYLGRNKEAGPVRSAPTSDAASLSEILCQIQAAD